MGVLGCVGVCMSMRACSLAYPACNAYTPYCDVIFDPSSSTIFSGISEFRFPVKFLSKTFLILRTIQR
jgi:hypothetical protein